MAGYLKVGIAAAVPSFAEETLAADMEDSSLSSSRQWRTQEFCWGGSTNSVEDGGQRERGSGDCSPLVRDSRGSCNLVQEIPFHIVKFSSFLVL